MSVSAEARERLISSFRAELTEHVQTMTNGLLALEQGAGTGEQRQSVLENTFRAAHSLKGAARAVGVTAIEQLAHALESVLEKMQHDVIELMPELFTACYQTLDAIQAVQAAYEAGETTPPVQALQALADLASFQSQATLAKEEAGKNEPSIPAALPPDEGKAAPNSVPTSGGSTVDQTIRVNVGKLDALMAQLSELLVTKIRAERHLTQLRQLQGFLAQWHKEGLAVRNAHSRLTRWDAQGNGRAGLGKKDVTRLLGYVGNSLKKLREMNASIGDLARTYADDTMRLSLVIDELEEEIKQVRLLSLSTITGPFGRMVRDMAQKAGKEAMLRVAGSETEVDKQVLERIKDPLIHLLRNAVDHGIELPERREATGKPRRGKITLTAEQLGKNVVICVADDGAGLDLEAIRQTVAQRDGIDAQSLTDAELVEAIFRPGVSTSPIITDISGRGVGLDVVRRNIGTLQGRIHVDWTAGEGAAFTLVIPLALTSLHGLLVRTSGELFALPLNNVEHITLVKPEEITSLEGRDTVRHDGRPIPLVWLSDVLELPRSDAQHGAPGIQVVILETVERRMALAVDELVGEQEVVVKGLGKQLVRVGGIAGATILGSGEVVLILNVADLIKLGLRGEYHPILKSEKSPSPLETRARQRILVVDDSITTRTLEKNILEAIGYTVQVATDGEEALNAITTGGVPDLIITDIVMPRVDGFELTRQIKSNPKTAHVPVILVTSLGSAKDQARGIEAGADAYIAKSGFDQGNLLETIEQLI